MPTDIAEAEPVARLAAGAADSLERIRRREPRTHCLTNSVAQTLTANVLLAIGASPAISMALDEIDQLVADSAALVINLGTLDEARRAGKRELEGLSDLQGLKFRIPGLGGDVMERLGALPVVVPPAEIYPALRSGIVDAAEFLGPWSDRSLALQRVAPFYYLPSFTKPNGTGECLVDLKAWRALTDDLKAIVAYACQAEHAVAYFEWEWENAKALEQMVADEQVELRRWPDEVLAAARDAADAVLAEYDSLGGIERRIYRSYLAARDLAESWSAVSAGAFIEARSDG